MKRKFEKKKTDISVADVIIFVTSGSCLQKNIFYSMHIREYRRRVRRTECIGVSDRRICTWTSYNVDNKSCQGAKAITTWPRALSRESRAFPFAGVASRKSSLKSELKLNFAVTEMSFKERLQRVVLIRES